VYITDKQCYLPGEPYQAAEKGLGTLNACPTVSRKSLICLGGRRRFRLRSALMKASFSSLLCGKAARTDL
jgi:hypothetical protein